MERGHRSGKTLLDAVAECYIEGASTRITGKILDQFGIKTMSSTQVSNTNKYLDEGFEARRKSNLGEYPYLILCAGYDELPLTGIVRDVALLTAGSIDWRGNRRILGVSVEVNEAKLHWREFKECRVLIVLRGVEYIVFDAPPS